LSAHVELASVHVAGEGGVEGVDDVRVGALLRQRRGAARGEAEREAHVVVAGTGGVGDRLGCVTKWLMTGPSFEGSTVFARLALLRGNESRSAPVCYRNARVCSQPPAIAVNPELFAGSLH